MKKRTSKYLSALMAAIMLIAAMVVPASAASSIEDQMAANSAASSIWKPVLAMSSSTFLPPAIWIRES